MRLDAIAALHVFVWLPLIAWSDKFKLQTVEEVTPPRSWVLDLLSRSLLVERFSELVIAPLGERLDAALGRGREQPTRIATAHRGTKLIGAIALGVLIAAVVYGGALAIAVIASLRFEEWLHILAAAGATFLRVLAALLIAIAWTLPLGIAIGTNRRLADRLMLVTGMITATGGAWNASIVAEYVRFAGETHQTLGLAALMAALSEAADFSVLLASTLVMVAIVVLINRLFWRRLYVLAETRFHLD